MKSIIEVKFALRDEKTNILAMTEGGFPVGNSHQIMLCKRKRFLDNRIGPFLLDAKKGKSRFKMSNHGLNYSESIDFKENTLKYIAYVESQIQIKIDINLFNDLYENGIFCIWDPQGPLEYFNGLKSGYIILFRVYEISDMVNSDLLTQGRKGRNYYFNLDKVINANLAQPVLNDSEYNKEKSKIMNICHKYLL